MPDTHDERGGDAGVGRKPRIVPELTEELLRTIPVPIAAAVWQLMLREKLRDQQLAAATARAEKAEAERREDVAAARRERDEAKAETANLSACLMLMMVRYGNQTFHEGDVKRAAELMAAMVADAPQDGLSATETAEDGVQGSGVELEFGNGSAGLSEPEATE